MVGQHIGGLKHDLDHRIGGGKLSGSHIVQCGFKHMGKAHQGVEAKGTRPALDRMHSAKHRIDRFRIAVALFHGEQAGFQLGQLLFAFLEKRNLDGF